MTILARYWTVAQIRRASLMITWVIMLLLALAACDGPEERYSAYMDRGKALFETGNYVQASLEFRNALQIKPDDAWALYYTALTAEADGRIQAAVSGFKRAADRHPRHGPTLIKIATYALVTSNFEVFSAHLSALQEIDPENSEVLALEAGMLLNQGHVPEARAIAEQAIQIDPGNESAVGVLSEAHALTEDYESAIQVLTDGLRHSPESVALRVVKLQTFYKLNQLHEAEELLREITVLQPNKLVYLGELTQLLVRMGRTDEAEIEFREAVQSKPDNVNLRLLYIGFLEAHRGLRDAEAELAKFIESAPADLELRFALADLQQKQDNTSGAAATYRSVIEENGEGAFGLRARIGLAKIVRDAGDKGDAQRLVDEVIIHDPNNVDALIIRAQTQMGDGETLSDAELDKIIGDLRIAVHNDPASVPASRLLAEAYVRRGQPGLATETMRELLDLAPLAAGQALNLARLMLGHGQPRGAMDLINEVVATAPNDVNGLRLKTAASMRLGQWDTAESAAQQLAAMGGQEVFAHRALAMVNVMRRDFAAALEEYRVVESLEPRSNAAAKGIIRSMLALGQAEEGLALLERAIADHGDSADLLVVKAEYYAEIDQIDKAKETYETAIRIEPDSVIAVNGLAKLYLETGDTEQAIAVYEQARSSRKLDTASEYRLADAYMKLGDAASAINVYQRVLEDADRNRQAANNLAALIADYQPDDPERLRYARDLTKDFELSDNPYLLDTLGWVHYRLGNYTEAIAFLERAVSAKSVPQIHYHLGMAYHDSNQPVPAKMHLEEALAEDVESFPGIEEARESLIALQTASEDL